jgi:hypothetical protein
MPVKHTRHSRGTLVPAVTAPDTTVAYARLAGMSQAALTAAMEPYLPIVCVDIVLGGWATSAQRERLIQRIEAALRPED